MRRALKSLLKDRKAATAVEFAFVAPLFFALVFSTIEAGWTMTQGMMLDRALDQTIRLVRLGSADAPKTQDAIRSAICSRTPVILDCRNVLSVEMVQINTPADFPTDAARCVDRSGAVNPTLRFSNGERASIMYVRACAVVDPVTPLMGLALALPKDSTGGYRLVSTSAFMNEPG
ncbi:TadE/TadG family type IV pilus assembly protein [Aureimonas sp. SA4125]|uniref:TadE/TadG family type IV pilus assembly protein n=1 Tax=Aureimonas sp. SA4125 TaxID=2826993 RepID=UPI001CC4F2DF|nr:TadE/TadG family type IV pilus assembly protein [Aureimonas sp. SA4125]